MSDDLLLFWLFGVYFLGSVLMWAMISTLDDADAYRSHYKKIPSRPKTILHEKMFLCLVWPAFSIIYIGMERAASIQKKGDEK